MQPQIHLNWIAIVVAVIASFAVGGLWYGPLFGGPWKKEMGVPPDAKPAGGEIGKSLGLNLFGTFLVAFVLAHGVLGHGCSRYLPAMWEDGIGLGTAGQTRKGAEGLPVGHGRADYSGLSA